MCELLKQIMREVPEDFIRRMRNWARAKAGVSLGYAQVNLEAVAGGGYRESLIPTLGGEAEDTDAALQTLPVRVRQAVQLFWAWEDVELTVLARKCGGIDRRTFAARVVDGHLMLRCELARRAEVWRVSRVACELAINKVGVAG